MKHSKISWLFLFFWCGYSVAESADHLDNHEKNGFTLVAVPTNEVLWAVTESDDRMDLSPSDVVLYFATDTGSGSKYRLTAEFFSDNSCASSLGSFTYVGTGDNHRGRSNYRFTASSFYFSVYSGSPHCWSFTAPTYVIFSDGNSSSNKTACTQYTVSNIADDRYCAITSGSYLTLTIPLVSAT